jgi:transcriptional regulator with XRE-family HTH domain
MLSEPPLHREGGAMAARQHHDNNVPRDATLPSSLGAFIKKARQDVSMSQRDVEEATNKEVSNGYLSQLESGKITKPSPHVLYALSSALSIDYEALMHRAGYILPGANRAERAPDRPNTYRIENLTSDEEAQLLEYLAFLRAKKK